MRTVFLTLVFIGAFAAGAEAQTAPAAPESVAQSWVRYPRATEVTVRNAAALVRVTPEDRADVALSIVNPGPLPAPELRMQGDRLIVDGKLRRQIQSCRVDGRNFQVQTRRQGRLNTEQLPIIELRVPRDATVSTGGAVRLHMAPARTARIAVEGCGDADIVGVEREVTLAVAGASDVRLYDAGEATVSIAGAGDVVIGVVRNGLTLSIAGGGDVTAARADGPTSIAVQGAGDVTIRDGRATTLSIAIAGAGDVTHSGSAAQLDAVILGAGDVAVRQVDGEVNRRVLGAGEVRVGR